MNKQRVTLLSLVLGIAISGLPCRAQEAASSGPDPFKVKQPRSGAVAGNSSPSEKVPVGPQLNLVARVEMFSMPIQQAGELLRQGTQNPQIYDQAVSKAKLERIFFTRSRNELASMGRSTLERRFVSEVNVSEGEKNGEKAERKGGVDLAFQTRNVGSDFHSSFNSGDGISVQGDLGIEVSALVDKESLQGAPPYAEQPVFAGLSLSVNVDVGLGDPHLISVQPSPFAKEKENAEERVWFTFLTVEPVPHAKPAPKK